MHAHRLPSTFLAALAFVLVPPRGAGALQEEGPADPVGPESFELAEATVRIPFELAKSRPVPVVEAQLNGEGPFRFFLDTAAQGCVLDTRLMKELGLLALGTTEIGDPSGNAPLSAAQVELEELTLGGLTARGLPAVAFDRGALDGGDNVRGVLGLSLFTSHLWTLDYVEQVVTVRAGELDPAAAHTTGFELVGVPRILIDVDGTLLEATVDSGSPSGFSLPHASVQERAFLEPLAVIARGRTVNSEFVLRGGRLDGDISMVGHVFADPFVLTNELFEHVNIGYEVLRHFALTIDLAHRRLAFERRGTGALELARPAPPGGPRPAAGGGERRRLGAELTEEPGGLRITGVLAGTEAERSGLRAGDLVLRIDGRPVGAQGATLLAGALAGSAPIALGVERDGQSHELELFPRSGRGA